jgi:hypothetical protein
MSLHFNLELELNVQKLRKKIDEISITIWIYIMIIITTANYLVRFIYLQVLNTNKVPEI